eukprot:gene12446-6198_t
MKLDGLKQDYSYFDSEDKYNENLIISFHGFGDTKKSYLTLAKNMKLPQTAILVANGTKKVPEWIIPEGYSWFDSKIPGLEDIFSTYSTSTEINIISGQWVDIIKNLVEKHSFKYQNIFLLGFSQGATMCCLISLSLKQKLGGLICISPSCLELLFEYHKNELKNLKIPIYFSHGILDDKITTTDAKKNYDRVKKLLGNDDDSIIKLYKKQHQMISSPEEMKDIMEFIAPKMYLRNIQLEKASDIYEVK